MFLIQPLAEIEICYCSLFGVGLPLCRILDSMKVGMHLSMLVGNVGKRRVNCIVNRAVVIATDAHGLVRQSYELLACATIPITFRNISKLIQTDTSRPDIARIGFCAKRDPFEIFGERCGRRLERFSLSLFALLRASDGHPKCR